MQQMVCGQAFFAEKKAEIKNCSPLGLNLLDLKEQELPKKKEYSISGNNTYWKATDISHCFRKQDNEYKYRNPVPSPDR